MESIVPPVLQVRKLTRGRYGPQPHNAMIFPASLPVSKPHHEREMQQTPSVISTRGPCSKTSRLLSMACKAHHYPALPLGFCGLLLTRTPASCPATQSSFPCSQYLKLATPLAIQAATPVRLAHLSLNAKPYPRHSPPARLTNPLSVFAFFPNSKHRSLKHLF